MNNFTVEFYINNEWVRNDRAVFTPKFANLLDEQLDEATITLKGDSKDYYKPFTLVKITITNNPECKLSISDEELLWDNRETKVEQAFADNRITQTYILHMFVANDKAIETPVGSRRYNHELYIIELTKLIERHICDTLTFTNSFGTNYLAAQTLAQPTDEKISGFSNLPEDVEITYDSYKTPINETESFTVLSINSVATKIKDYLTNYQDRTNVNVTSVNTVNNNQIYNKITIDNNGQVSTVGGFSGFTNYNQTATITSPKNIIKITYVINIQSTNSGGSTLVETYSFSYYLYAVSNRLPLKKWTITDVINRVFDLVEPLEVNSETASGASLELTPKFKLDATQSNKYDSILAPEFSFTKATLREVLQQIGGFIHAEPRIKTIENNQFIVSFDEYGSNKYSKISKKPYITATFGTDINQYCTAIDSSADNLTNTLDWAQGVIVEPYEFAYKSLRSENVTVRLQEDDNTYIATQFPIAKIQQVSCEYIPGIGKVDIDITPYIFEYTAYSSELSSYDGGYPFSKSYAIYYTMGQKNIKGLFFKAPDAINPIFKNYSIINILRAASGNKSLNVTGQDLMQLSFNVTYMPLYSVRIKTHKQLIQEGDSSTLAYNQVANAIESRYYGEHLKGVVERLGNVEKTYTYKLAFLSQIPVVGTRFDNNYYISNVSWELFPTYIKCTVGLSKHFNRLSQYVGINSQKRMWEISERQSQIRQSVFTNYIVISTEEQKSEYWASEKIGYPANILFNAGTNYLLTSISLAAVKTLNINKESLLPDNTWIYFPVIASAFGNSMAFTYSFEDNYSVGQKVKHIEGDSAIANNTVTGYWADNIKYTDYYGKFYYLETFLVTTTNENNQVESLTLPQITKANYPANYLLNRRYLYRKDNREIPQITHQITVVTDNEDIIIGSALCRNCRAVNKNGLTYRWGGYSLYVFNESLNLLDGKPDLSKAISTTSATIDFAGDSIVIKATAEDANNIGKSWAIVTKSTTKTIDVEAEDGTKTTQTIQEGGEILLAQNNVNLFDYNNGLTLYFAVKRKIND